LSDKVVKLTEVGNEAEAATIVGYLESQGIHATYDKGGTSSALAAYSGPGEGRQQILVLAEELDAARAALTSIEATEPR
jgi:putative signal transducing protein